MSQSINLYNQLANNKLFNKSVNFDLKRIKFALNKLENPERKLKNIINVIGSDGKFTVLNTLKYFIEENNQTPLVPGASGKVCKNVKCYVYDNMRHYANDCPITKTRRQNSIVPHPVTIATKTKKVMVSVLLRLNTI